MIDQEARAEWLEWRREGIGASDVASLLGGRWGTPWTVYQSKVNPDPGDDHNDYQEFGLRAEPMLTRWFMDRTGLYAYGTQARVTHPDHPHRRATLDGYVAEAPGGDPIGVLELKTTGAAISEPPAEWRWQAQWQMHVTGLDMCWVGALVGRTFHVWEIARDDLAIGMAVEAADELWGRVQRREPPPLSGHPAEHDAAKATPADPAADAADLSVVSGQLAVVRRLRDERKSLEKELKAAEAEVMAVLGESTAGVVDGDVVVTWNEVASERIDTKALRAEAPELADKFTKVSTYRRLVVK